MRPAAAVVVVGPLLLALVMASASVSGGAAAPPQSQPRAPSAFLQPIRGLFGRRRSQATPTGAVTVRAATVPTDLVEALREAPWRTGLEPAEDCALLEAPTVEVRRGADANPPHISDRLKLMLVESYTGRAAEGPGRDVVQERRGPHPRRGAPPLRALVRRCVYTRMMHTYMRAMHG